MSVDKSNLPAAATSGAPQKSPDTPDNLPSVQDRVQEELKPVLDQLTRSRPELARQTVERVTRIVQQELYQGPLPHPSHFAQFEKILPGSADRIFQMAEREQQHRHTWERSAINKEFYYSMGGLIFGFVISLALIAGAIYLALQERNVVAAALVGAGAVGMVGSVIKGRQIFARPGSSTAQQPPAKSNQTPKKPKKRR